MTFAAATSAEIFPRKPTNHPKAIEKKHKNIRNSHKEQNMLQYPSN